MFPTITENRTPCLEWLIQPVNPDVFFQRYWTESALSIDRDNRDYFKSVLTLDDIDQAISSLSLTFPDLSLVNAAREVRTVDYVRAGNIVDLDALYREFADGSTIILSHLHNKLPSLAGLCQALESELCSPIQTNIYLTPSKSKGFKCHYDTHDVIILQAAGSKHWRLYGMPVRLPLWGQDFDSKIHETGPITMEVNLHAGDALYIPRGLVHDAEATEQTSLHITVGILAYTWADLLLESFAAVILQNPELRRSLPVGFARPDFDATQARSKFAHLASQFVTAADFAKSVDCFVEEFVRTRKPQLTGQIEQLRRLDELDLGTAVSVRPHLVHKIVENEELVLLRCFAKVVTFPRRTRKALAFALSKPNFKVHELPDLDDDSKIVVIKRLIREGIFMQL